MVRDGETVVIGGLIESRDVQTVKRIPFLGYLPVIGWLFSSETTEIKRTEIIVLLTPKVLEDGDRLDDGDREIERAAARRDRFREGFGPVARVEYARRQYEAARTALDEGALGSARRLCDHGLLLDPLADGAIELSHEIDARLAEKSASRRSAAIQGG
jgi:Flp pilus assembly secretin CpaC